MFKLKQLWCLFAKRNDCVCNNNSYILFCSQIPLNFWAIFYPHRFAELADELIAILNKVAGPIGIRVGRPTRVDLRDDRTETYVKSIHSQLTSEV